MKHTVTDSFRFGGKFYKSAKKPVELPDKAAEFAASVGALKDAGKPPENKDAGKPPENK